MDEKLCQKGRGSFISTHEILGVVTEEYFELVEAIKTNDTREIRLELLDVIVSSLFGLACIEQDEKYWCKVEKQLKEIEERNKS